MLNVQTRDARIFGEDEVGAGPVRFDVVPEPFGAAPAQVMNDVKLDGACLRCFDLGHEGEFYMAPRLFPAWARNS